MCPSIPRATVKPKSRINPVMSRRRPMSSSVTTAFCITNFSFQKKERGKHSPGRPQVHQKCPHVQHQILDHGSFQNKHLQLTFRDNQSQAGGQRSNSVLPPQSLSLSQQLNHTEFTTGSLVGLPALILRSQSPFLKVTWRN